MSVVEPRFGGRCERHLSPKPCAHCAAMREYTAAEVRLMLERQAKERGSQKALAAALDVSESYLSDVLADRREPGDKLLEAIGMERVVFYRNRNDGGSAVKLEVKRHE